MTSVVVSQLTAGPVRGELAPAPGTLLARAHEAAAAHRSPNTRRAYLATYRQFAAFVGGPDAGAEPFTREAMRRYRDQLENSGAAASTVARHLSALRRLADELDLDPTIGRVRSDAAPPRPPRALTPAQYDQLLRGPDRRSTRGLRDHAILRVLGDCGRGAQNSQPSSPRTSRASHVTTTPRLRPAVAPARGQQTGWDLHVRRAKRGKARCIPLSEPALQALTAWWQRRPAAGH